MYNKRIFRFAQAILDLKHGDIKSPTEAFINVVRNKNLLDFYNIMDPDSFIKICIAVWGFSRNFSTAQIENIFDKVFFATVFYTNGTQHTETCDYCSGDGRQQCHVCDGTGNDECRECDGDGEVTCDDCDGDGEVETDEGGMEKCSNCDGKGTYDCLECDGSGKESCSSCGGDGDVYCQECDGDGEVETDKTEYSVEFVVCWSPALYDTFETAEEQIEPIMATTQWEKNDNIMRISTGIFDDELISEIDFDEIYVLQVFRERPKINFFPHRGADAFGLPPYPMEHLLA